MKVNIKSLVLLATSALLALVGMGSSCPGTGSSATFENSVLLNLAPAAASTMGWHVPAFVDPGQADVTSACLSHEQSVVLAALGHSPYPSAIFNDSPNSFYVAFTRANAGGGACGVPDQVNPLVVGNPYVSSYSDWANGSLASYTQLDATINASGADAQRPTVAIDSANNGTLLVAEKTAAAANRWLYAARHNYSNGAWSPPVLIGSLGVAADVLNSMALSTDAYNNAVAVWVQNGFAWYNEYRPNLGWRNSGTFTSYWNDTADNTTVADSGADIGFDGYGNGYGLYVTAGPAIKAVRWKGNAAAQFSDPVTRLAADTQTISTGVPGVIKGFPRIYVAPDGQASAFFYVNYAAPTQTAELWYIHAPAPSPGSNPIAPGFSSGTRTRFDLNAGVGSAIVANNATIFPPILTYNGSSAAVGFIKSDGVSNRLFIYQYSGGAWNSVGTADIGGAGANVLYASLATNQNGDIAVVYSALSGATEHVYGNVYQHSGGWNGAQQLDAVSSLAPANADDLSRPSVSIDANGLAAATFSMSDTAAFPFTPHRRVVVSLFY